MATPHIRVEKNGNRLSVYIDRKFAFERDGFHHANEAIVQGLIQDVVDRIVPKVPVPVMAK